MQLTTVSHRNLVLFASLSLLWHCGSLRLPQMIMNRQSVYTNGHGFGWNQVKLLSVRAVFIKLVDHFLRDALWSCSCQLVDFFCVRIVAVKCPELAASITEQNDVMVGITLLQLLEVKKKHSQGDNKTRLLSCWQHIH